MYFCKDNRPSILEICKFCNNNKSLDDKLNIFLGKCNQIDPKTFFTAKNLHPLILLQITWDYEINCDTYFNQLTIVLQHKQSMNYGLLQLIYFSFS